MVGSTSQVKSLPFQGKVTGSNPVPTTINVLILIFIVYFYVRDTYKTNCLHWFCYDAERYQIWFDSIKQKSIYNGAWGCLVWPSACHAEDSDEFDSRKHRK